MMMAFFPVISDPHSLPKVIHTFLVSFLISTNWTVDDQLDLYWNQDLFHHKYKGHDGTMAGYGPIRDRHLGIRVIHKVEAPKVPFDDLAKATIR